MLRSCISKRCGSALYKRPVVNAFHTGKWQQQKQQSCGEEAPHRKHHLNQHEQKEQSMFDKNKATLEEMEHEHVKPHTLEKPDMEQLKKIGDDARIEQNRPDDGVY